MFGRFGWAEILVIVVLVVILFGHNKIPGMMKNLADLFGEYFRKKYRRKWMKILSRIPEEYSFIISDLLSILHPLRAVPAGSTKTALVRNLFLLTDE